MGAPNTAPPGAVFELAERAVEFVRKAVGLTLDYTPETLPVLDHYLTQVPQDQPEIAALVASAAGAYFGEVARRACAGSWEDVANPEPGAWRLVLSGGVAIVPVGVAIEAIARDDTDGGGGFDVPDDLRPMIEDALVARGEVPEDEYYSLSGKLELLTYVVDLVVAARKPPDDDGEGSTDADDSKLPS